MEEVTFWRTSKICVEFPELMTLSTYVNESSGEAKAVVVWVVVGVGVVKLEVEVLAVEAAAVEVLAVEVEAVKVETTSIFFIYNNVSISTYKIIITRD